MTFLVGGSAVGFGKRVNYVKVLDGRIQEFREREKEII